MQCQWVIKASTLCNLRCSYCYEWDELGNPARMTSETWRSVFTAMHAQRTMESEKRREPFPVYMILHGGEPLLLPLDYLEEVMAMKREILGTDAEDNFGAQSNAIQTNLYRLTDDHIDFLKRHRFSVGVSFDFVPGVRLNVAGQDSQERTLANIERLFEAGISVGVITVLAKHTAPHVTRIYDFLSERGIAMRILPLFDGPDSRNYESFEISDDDKVAALRKLFLHWMEHGARTNVLPFRSYLQTVIRKLLHFPTEKYTRAIHGESVLVVDRNGDISLPNDPCDPRPSPLGNVTTQSFASMIQTPTYLAALERDPVMFRTYCRNCPYDEACMAEPLHSTYHPGNYQGRCPIGSRTLAFMEDFLRDAGFDETELKAMFDELSASVGDTQRAAMELCGV